MIVVVSVVFGVVLVVSILWFIRRMFVRHDPKRAVASVAVAANAPFELQLPGSAGELFFRFDIHGDTDSEYDLLISGEVIGDGGSRAFAVKTSANSRIKGADGARKTSTTYAVTNTTGSISLTQVETGDRAVRGVVLERPAGLLRSGWIYVPA